MLLGLALFVLPLAAACSGGGSSGTAPDKVVLIGIESLSLLQIEDMVSRGELPNLARMMREGTRARLRCPDPLLSPMLWSTLLTGQDAVKHQMTAAYVRLDEGVTVAPSSMRTAPSLFQIVSSNRQMVASIGFPGTWPAEVLNGFNLSHGAIPSRLVEAAEHSFPREAGDRAAFPESLYDRALDHYTPVEDMDRADTSPFFVLREDEFSMLYDQPLGSIFRLDNPLRDFALSLQRDRAQVALSGELLAEFPLKILGIHLELTDGLQPVYWRAAWPDHYTIPEDARRRFRETIDECYRRLDEWIGALSDAAGDNAVICVVGNRGFGHGTDEMSAPGEAPELMPSVINETLLLLMGPGVRRGTDLGAVDLVDVTPTLLTVLDIAVGTGMDGAVLDAAFTDAFRAGHPRRSTEPYTDEFRSAPRYPSQLREAARQRAASPTPEDDR